MTSPSVTADFSSFILSFWEGKGQENYGWMSAATKPLESNLSWHEAPSMCWELSRNGEKSFGELSWKDSQVKCWPRCPDQFHLNCWAQRALFQSNLTEGLNCWGNGVFQSQRWLWRATQGKAAVSVRFLGNRRRPKIEWSSQVRRLQLLPDVFVLEKSVNIVVQCSAPLSQQWLHSWRGCWAPFKVVSVSGESLWSSRLSSALQKTWVWFLLLLAHHHQRFIQLMRPGKHLLYRFTKLFMVTAISKILKMSLF